ncbi:MAG: UDP-N-acetylmuramate dehydrogenase [Bacteroidetes bacterium]|nr:UDP-N-acetylmuramate dehydrogenase [Bacteroidota bacterium]MBS1642817.1 UDP-N-acetylmuramate dehydrogenase [Bacteroidota bacterium]MBS1670308.1 UDP-N-acetylmuramate dehydrogenase [Bacteroidota bacterium]
MKIENNVSLKKHNSFGIDIVAKQFAIFQSINELEEIISYSTCNIQHATLILGGGSNILFTKNFDGIVFKNELKGIEVVKEDAEHIYVKAAAGELWHNVVLYCIKNNYAGIENLSLIPGCVGAAPIQNIGAYGVELKDIFYELQAYHLHDKTIQTFKLTDCNFGYRESIFKNKFKNQFVIVNVILKLNKQPIFHTQYGAIEKELETMKVKELSIQNISQAVINIRSAKLPNPKIIGNAGSFFKNPIVSKFRRYTIWEYHKDVVSYAIDEMNFKLAAAWLIEKCGWKGYRKGDAGCNPLQPLVLVNYGNATGQEIYDLSEQIIQSVKKEFSVVLEREVNII